MLNYFTISTSAEMLCFIVALICLRNDKSRIWQSMILFLLIICITELLGVHFKKVYLADRVHNLPNLWLYNVLLIFQAGFISLMFQHLLNKYVNSKSFIIAGLAVLAVIYIYEAITHGILLSYNELTNTVMLVFFVLYSLFYYYCLLRDDRSPDLKYLAGFWWVAGLFFFYFGSTTVNIFFDYIHPDKSIFFRKLSKYIFNSLNVIMYSCWAYSFICRKWLTTRSED
jgi:hypothetical protein